MEWKIKRSKKVHGLAWCKAYVYRQSVLPHLCSRTFILTITFPGQQRLEGEPDQELKTSCITLLSHILMRDVLANEKNKCQGVSNHSGKQVLKTNVPMNHRKSLFTVIHTI